ncbi:MAG: hypothetical protein Q9221_007203 [Calogaya cf. arnoldii]
MRSPSVYGLQALTLFISLSLSSPLSAFSKRQDLDPAVCADPRASLDAIRTAFAIVSERIDVIEGITALVYPNNQDPNKGAPFRQNLQKLTSQMTDEIDRALQDLMTNAETFARFADNGRYSGSKPAIDGETLIQGLATTLKTYTVSHALKATNWYEVALEKTTKEQYDAREVSPTDPIYFSPSTLRQYKLAQTGGAEPATLLRELPKYADLTILFDGAFNCTAEGGQGGGGPIINFNFDGTLRLDCLSQLPATIPCGAPCPEDYSDGACPFIQVEGC